MIIDLELIIPIVGKTQFSHPLDHVVLGARSEEDRSLSGPEFEGSDGRGGLVIDRWSQGFDLHVCQADDIRGRSRL